MAACRSDAAGTHHSGRAVHASARGAVIQVQRRERGSAPARVFCRSGPEEQSGSVLEAISDAGVDALRIVARKTETALRLQRARQQGQLHLRKILHLVNKDVVEPQLSRQRPRAVLSRDMRSRVSRVEGVVQTLRGRVRVLDSAPACFTPVLSGTPRRRCRPERKKDQRDSTTSRQRRTASRS